MDSSPDTPTWSKLIAEFLEHGHTWFPPDCLAALQTYTEAGTRAAFALVSDSPPRVVDTCVMTISTCTAICAEAVEVLGGVQSDAKAAVAILDLTASARPTFEALIGAMSPSAQAVVLANYDKMTELLVVISTIRVELVPLACRILDILSAGLRQAVDSSADGTRIGSAMWEEYRRLWADTGRHPPVTEG